jgi:hypothetical protein
MHTPGQFGPPAIFAFAPLCTKRERSQIGTGNRVRTGELPIRVDQFLAIRSEKLWPEPSAEISTLKKTPPCQRPTRWRAMHLHRVPSLATNGRDGIVNLAARGMLRRTPPSV